MKLTTNTHVSLDGVMQGSAGAMRTAGEDSSAVDGRFGRAVPTPLIGSMLDRAEPLIDSPDTTDEGTEDPGPDHDSSAFSGSYRS